MIRNGFSRSSCDIALIQSSTFGVRGRFLEPSFCREFAELVVSLVRERTAALAHSRKIFDRSSVAAKIGLWECTLPEETLQWTDVVYDLFDLPRGSPLNRTQIVKYYSEDSVKELHMRRSKAIAERNGYLSL